MKYLKRFNESSVDRIDISDIDELKDLFTDFVDDFGYQFKEMVIGDISNDREPFRKINYTEIGKYNVYLFDGPHEEEDQYDGLMYVQPALDDEFIFICDDWNWEKVRNGTMNAIKKLNLDVLFSIDIKTTDDNSYPPENDTKQNSDWHNGYYISVLRKNETN